MQTVDRLGRAVECKRHAQWLGDAAHGQLAVQHAVTVVFAFDAGTDEVCVAVFRAIEQCRLANGRIPGRIAHVQAR